MKRVQETNVVAEGEVTGHAHRLQGGGTILVDDETGAKQIVLGENGGSLTHEEHNELHLDKQSKSTTFDVIPVREIDPLTNLARNVAD